LVKQSRAAEGLVWAALALTVVAATGGLAVAGLDRDNAAMIRQAQASDLATIVVAAPVLAIGLWRAAASWSRRSARDGVRRPITRACQDLCR
jgi:hypothetical protein